MGKSQMFRGQRLEGNPAMNEKISKKKKLVKGGNTMTFNFSDLSAKWVAKNGKRRKVHPSVLQYLKQGCFFFFWFPLAQISLLK